MRRYRPIPVLTQGEIDRFWSKVNRSGGPNACWEWQASLNNKGYGRISIRGQCFIASRVAFSLSHESPEKTEVCHNCPNGDNPKCCNPAHLWNGTHAENCADMVQKGRSAAGEDHSQVKLSAIRIQSIRESSEYQHILAEQNGVSRATISNIKSGKVWSHTGDVASTVSLICQGERSPNAKLTDQDVVAIRASNNTDSALAAYYKVSRLNNKSRSQ